MFNRCCMRLGALLIAGPTLADPLTVWNQAYQETYNADSIETILAEAENAYVLLDPFDPGTPVDWSAHVAALHAKGNEVSAYISIGTGEDWREDFDALKPSLVASSWEAWGGEYFVDRVDATVTAVMQSRIDRIAAMGFDWVEFDNMDWAFDHENRALYGFHTTTAESQAYASGLCRYAHSKGVKCMAKSMVEDLPVFDGATYESYVDQLDWWDQDAARALLRAGKPVLIIHYDSTECAAVLDHYEAFYGPDVSFLCETETAGGYERLPRSH